MKKLLIIGGYGTFGGRLVELLENTPALTLMVGGRSLAKAKAFCADRAGTKATLLPSFFDRNGHLATQLSALTPDIVIDASGPFQAYGAECYALVEACIKAGIHYLDLADGADFVEGITAYNNEAQVAGVFILSGVSSFPVLTALVVRELSQDIARLDQVYGGIAPSPFAGVGENVIRAIAGYAGKKTKLRKNGIWMDAYPLTENLRYTIAPPGMLPLRNILFSLVEVPDLRVLPPLYPSLKTVWMGAGPVPEILHRALIGFAWLVRWKILPSLTPMVKLIQLVMNHCRWGEHRGGMFVQVTGQGSDGKKIRKSWHLLAEGRDGPFIPCMAVEAVIRKLMEGATIAPGARSPVNDLMLADYERIFAGKTIYTGFRQDLPLPSMPLYRNILGNAWDRLPAEIRSMHDVDDAEIVHGRARVTRGESKIAQKIADLFGFPAADEDIAVSVQFTAKDGTEKWTRTFGDKSFSSTQHAGKGHWQRLLIERFGPLQFAMALVLESDNRLRLVLRHWRAFGIPIPLCLCPKSDSYETVGNGKFRFNVRISLPMIGLIVHYQGWLRKGEIEQPDDQF